MVSLTIPILMGVGVAYGPMGISTSCPAAERRPGRGYCNTPIRPPRGGDAPDRAEGPARTSLASDPAPAGMMLGPMRLADRRDAGERRRPSPRSDHAAARSMVACCLAVAAGTARSQAQAQGRPAQGGRRRRAAANAGPPLVLRPDRVFDGSDLRPHDGWVVVVRGEQIEAAGPADEVEVPDGAGSSTCPA